MTRLGQRRRRLGQSVTRLNGDHQPFAAARIANCWCSGLLRAARLARQQTTISLWAKADAIHATPSY
jgi:hypothetical protein